EGDVILKVGDQPVNDVAGLEEQIGRHRPGDKVTITVSRNNKLEEVPVTLQNPEGTTSMATPTETPAALSSLGASFSNASKEELNKLGISNGVKVIQLQNGKLRNIGVEEGFIITKIDHQKVSSPADIEKILGNKSGGVLVEGVYPNGMKAYYAFGA